MTDEVDGRADEDGGFRRRLAASLPVAGDPSVKPVEFAQTFADLTAVAMARAQWLGGLLRDQLDREGMKGLVGFKYGIDQRTGERLELSEEMRALARMEAQERDRAERMTRDGIRLGIEARRVDVMRHYAQVVGAVIREAAIEFGLNWNDPAVRRAAQRAVIRARQAQGQSLVSPDSAGPPMSSWERQRALGGGEPAESIET